MFELLICLSAWVFQISMSYIILLYWEFKKAQKIRSRWNDKSFAEWIYDGEPIQWDEPYIWLIMLIPYLGWLILILCYFIEFHCYIGAGRNFNPIRGILKLCFRKKYLRSRDSNEI